MLCLLLKGLLDFAYSKLDIVSSLQEHFLFIRGFDQNEVVQVQSCKFCLEDIMEFDYVLVVLVGVLLIVMDNHVKLIHDHC
jgi:hypothetical protein